MTEDTLQKIGSLELSDIRLQSVSNHVLQFGQKSSSEEATYNIQLAGGKASYSQMSKKRNRNEIKSMLLNKGASAIYITITPDDLKNPLAFVMSMSDPEQFDFDMPELSDEDFRAAQASLNPVGLAEFFHIITSTILSKLFNSDNGQGIFGPWNGHYGLVETQARGTLHIHLLLWIKNTMRQSDMFSKLKWDEEFRREVLEYINNILRTDESLSESSCIPEWNNIHELEKCEPCILNIRASKDSSYEEIPDPDDEDFFHHVCHRVFDAINSYQTHTHMKSCYKHKSKVNSFAIDPDSGLQIQKT
jgi:hypothetical protein